MAKKTVKPRATGPKNPAPSTDKYAITISTGKVVKNNMAIYGADVIEDRAVPDFRDGLKPGQRRILWAMKKDLHLSHAGATKKSAGVVGTVIASYHPHSDTGIYSTLTNMYMKRYRFVMPRGNFGSELEEPSAMRYTEVKFQPLHQDIFADMDVMELVPNFDSSTKEPLVINTRLPLYLMNGCSGIAVGLSVDVPPHNLKELVDALIYVVKNRKTATVDDVLKFISGPDFRNGGALISKKDELLAVYRDGRGMLEFQCDYVVGKDDDGRTSIEVIGFPDDVFSVQGFINECEKLREKGDVFAVEADYMDSRFGEKAVDGKFIKTHTVKVTVSNRKGLDAVLRKLTVRKTYQFYSTHRTAEGINLKTYNLLEVLKHWISWRKTEEKKVLDLELQRAEKNLWNETTRLVAMQPKAIQIIADALKQDRIEFEDYLVKNLKVTLEQAKYISEIQIKNLRKASIPEQEKKIGDIKKTIEVIKDDLVHISRVVIKHLKALSPYFDERRTRVGGRIQNTAKITVEHTGDPQVLMASRDGKLFGNVTAKGSTTSDVMAVASYEGAVIFDETGLTGVLSTSECTGKAGPAYKAIVGIAPAEASNLLVIGKNGYCVKMPGAEAHKQSEFNAIKGTEVLAGFGVDPTTQVLVWGKKSGEFACIRAAKIKEVRKNSAGTKLVNFKPVHALAVGDSQSLYTLDGSKVSTMKAGEITGKPTFYVLGERNILIFKSGKRKFLNRQETVKEIARDRKSIRYVYSVTVPDQVPPASEPSETKAKKVLVLKRKK